MSNDSVLMLMQEKLNTLEHAYVLETDPARKFSLKHQIEELKNQIADRQTPSNNHSVNVQNSHVGLITTGDNTTVHYHNATITPTTQSQPAKNPSSLRKMLYDQLYQFFSEEEIQKIRFSLQIDLDRRYESKSTLIMALIEYCERHQRIDELKDEMVRERPSLKDKFLSA